MQKHEVLKGISRSGTWLKYIQNATEALGGQVIDSVYGVKEGIREEKT